VPARTGLDAVAAEAASCRACELWRLGTQTVFGEGPPSAPIMLVGEQPGDREDVEGRPFVGPAGRILDGALTEAGISRSDVYLTNAVKHFKWRARGKRRIHERPNRTEVVACSRWLDAELELVDPRVVVALGATAGSALFGPSFRVGRSRGRQLGLDGRVVVATVHPSVVVRIRDREQRDEELAGLVADLQMAAGVVAGSTSP
jgi:uracil-DNA glycosylase